MRTPFLLLAIGATLVGCRPDFDSIEEACQDFVPGSDKASDNAKEAVQRGNCYRRLAGLGAASVDDKYAAASRSHARYVEQNGLGAAGQEDPTLPGFTGESASDRLRAQGYDLPENFATSQLYWTVSLPSVGGVSNEIDVWMDHWLTRQILLQPGVTDSGYGRSATQSVYENVSPFPSDDGDAYVYPKDGQGNVPFSVVNGFASEIIPEGEVIGYPITITVSSSELGSDLDDPNPYDLVLLDQRVLDPSDRLVPVYEIQPETTPHPFPYSVALVPREPLSPSTTYRVFARVSWIDGIKNVEATFTTGTDGVIVSDQGDLDDESARRAAYQRGLSIHGGVRELPSR